MANEKHLLLTIKGSYSAASLAAEEWQTTLRLALWGPTILPGGPDEIGTLSSSWNVVPETISRVETNWRIDGNWRVDFGAGLFFNPDDYLNDQVAPAIYDWFQNTIHWSGARIDALSLYPVGVGGTVIPAPPYAQGSPVTLSITGTKPAGTASGGGLPLQIAVVTSHRTPQTGRRGRGRMFLPGIAAGFVGSDGQIAATQRQEAADRQATLLESLTYSPPSDNFYIRPVVTGDPYTNYAMITQVQVGSVPDTQRRRRNALVETVSNATVSP